MATAPGTIDELLALLKPLGGATAKKMFGEYCIYLDDQPVALVCDDCLYVKVTDPGRAMSKNIAELPPYPGAKPHMEYPIDSWGNGHHLCDLLRATLAALLAKSARKPPARKSPTRKSVTNPAARTAKSAKPATKTKPRKSKK